MTEEPESREDGQDDVELPEDAVDDLEVEDGEGEDVSGGKWSDKW
jgi:hypothetical protein